MSLTPYQKLREAADFYQRSFPQAKPEHVIILGSGLGEVASSFKKLQSISFADIPYYYSPSIEGHSGEIVLCETKTGKQILIFKGRLHAYEGYPFESVMFAVRFSNLLGCKKLLVTNAAGSVNLSYKPGDMVLIKDHINMSGANPLLGHNVEELGPRFPDMTKAYSEEERSKIIAIANKLKISIHEGVYAYMMGPTYETPAEIKMLRTLGADMVGMSTVPDVIAARHVGMSVVGISCITNLGAGISNSVLKHDDVKIEAAKALEKIKLIMSEYIS